MRRIQRVLRGLPAAALLLGTAASAITPIRAGAATWEGLTQYYDTYNVQRPYTTPIVNRFSVTDYPIYSTWVQSSDLPHEPNNTTAPRTEMRWNLTWSGNEHLWGGYVWIDPGTDNAAFMQIKGATGGEAIYMMVRGGNIYQGFSNQALATNVFSHWFYMNTDYDPAAHHVHVWINGKLAITQSFGGGSNGYYFKNGVYHASGTSSAHFADITFWSGSASPADPPPAPAALPPNPPGPALPGGGGPVAPANAPYGVSGADLTNGTLSTGWTSPVGQSVFEVYVYGSDGSTKVLETPSVPSWTFFLTDGFVVSGLTPNTYYTFTVTGSDGTTWGPWSAWAPWAWVT